MSLLRITTGILHLICSVSHICTYNVQPPPSGSGSKRLIYRRRRHSINHRVPWKRTTLSFWKNQQVDREMADSKPPLRLYKKWSHPLHPKISKAAPKTVEDFQHLPVLRVSVATTNKPTSTRHLLAVYLDHNLQMTHNTNMAIAKGYRTQAMICTFSYKDHEISFTVVRHLIFTLLLW